MTARKWRAVVEFYADTPEHEDDADSLADMLGDGMEERLNAFSLIRAGSVSVLDLDTVPE